MHNKTHTSKLNNFTGKLAKGETIVLFKIRPEFASSAPSAIAATLTTFYGGGAAIQKMSRNAARDAYKGYLADGWKITREAV